MKEVAIVVLLFIVAGLAIAACRHSLPAFADYQVKKQVDEQNAELKRVLEYE